MTSSNEQAKGFGAQWSAASPARKFLTAVLIVAIVLVVVLVIMPLIVNIFKAGSASTR